MSISKFMPRMGTGIRSLLDPISKHPAPMPISTHFPKRDFTPSLSPVVRRTFSSQPSSLFFAHPDTKMWRDKIKACPESLDLDQVKNIQDKFNSLIAVLEKDGLKVDNITLQNEDLDKESIQKLLTTIAKTCSVLPGFNAINFEAESSVKKIVFRPDFTLLKGMEYLLRSKKLFVYQMQSIPLNERTIDVLSRHIYTSLQEKNVIILTVSDKAELLVRPKMDPKTNKPDLTPEIRSS